MTIEHTAPKDIEQRSFEIIRSELEKNNITLPLETEPVVMRAIHTTADFDYARTLVFSQNAVEIIKNLITAHTDIVTDTNMAAAGINKGYLEKYGCALHCFMADSDVAQEAKNRNTTRACVAMEKAAAMNKKLIFCIGNAPTALIKLRELMDEGYEPGFIVGVPVGFVNVCEAKELIIESAADYIVNRGRKGGSNVAAAIINAILYNI